MTKLTKDLNEDQIKFWLANTNLTREELLEWYNNFKNASAKSEKLDRESFASFFKKLNFKTKNADALNKLIFNGNFMENYLTFY
jgi:hypothetical protein